MKELWQKYQWWIIGVLLLFAVVIAIALTTYYTGKKAGKKAVVSNIPDLPGVTPLTNEERTLIQSYVNRLIGDLRWYNAFTHNNDLYQSLNLTTDRILLGVVAQYKSDTNGGDLIGDITGTFAIDLPGGQNIFDDTNALVKRLKALTHE